VVYRTKVGFNIWIFAVLTLVVDLGRGFLVDGVALAGFLFLIEGLVLVALLFLVWPTEYDPGASGPDGEPILFVRCGRLTSYKIPLAEISEIRPSAELASSPASWSYDRLKVVYAARSGFHRSLLISPRDRDGFLDELARRASHLERDGDSLIPRVRARPPETRS
jgi:hypothetical protein